MEENPSPEDLQKYLEGMKKEQTPLRKEMSKWIELMETRYLSEDEFWGSFERPLVKDRVDEESSFGIGSKEFELTVNQDGTIVIPAEIVRSILKDPGEKVKVTVTELEEYQTEDDEYVIWPNIKIE